MDAIQQLIADGKTDDEIVEVLMRETAVTEGDAREILAREKGEDVDDVVGGSSASASESSL